MAQGNKNDGHPSAEYQEQDNHESWLHVKGRHFQQIILRDTFSLTWSKLTKDIIYAIRWRLCEQLQRRAVALKQQAQKL